MKKTIVLLALLAVVGSATELAAAETKMKPFILASEGPGEMAAVVQSAKDKLAGVGFEIAGAYAPYPGATVIAVTNDALKQEATKTDLGAYAAAMRVSVTSVNGEIQIAYTNPTYMASAYRLENNLAAVKAKLAEAVGSGPEFGPEEGMDDEELSDYQYMFGMEEFDDQTTLERFLDHEEAVATIEKNLKAGVMGITKVYRIDIPGTKDVVFGVAMNGKNGGGDDQDDAFIMSEIDFKDVRSTAHLPYEILVKDDIAFTFSARYRIAINFPDLSMAGPNSFMNIMGAPGAITKALDAVANPY